MRTIDEIQRMFADMDLETAEKRSKFSFTYPYEPEPRSEVIEQIYSDKKTTDLPDEKHAELE